MNQKEYKELDLSYFWDEFKNTSEKFKTDNRTLENTKQTLNSNCPAGMWIMTGILIRVELCGWQLQPMKFFL